MNKELFTIIATVASASLIAGCAPARPTPEVTKTSNSITVAPGNTNILTVSSTTPDDPSTVLHTIGAIEENIGTDGQRCDVTAIAFPTDSTATVTTSVGGCEKHLPLPPAFTRPVDVYDGNGHLILSTEKIGPHVALLRVYEIGNNLQLQRAETAATAICQPLQFTQIPKSLEAVIVANEPCINALTSPFSSPSPSSKASLPKTALELSFNLPQEPTIRQPGRRNAIPIPGPRGRRSF